MNAAVKTIGDYIRLKGLTPDWAMLQRADACMNQPVHDLSDFKFAEGPYTVHQVRFVEPSPELFARLTQIGLRSLVYLSDGLYEVTRKGEEPDALFFEFRYHHALPPPSIPLVFGRFNIRPPQ